jgi:Restriction endonuclease
MKMPKRTNRFQRIVRFIYEQVTPAGGTVTESAMLPETGTGTLREVDILIEHSIAGHKVRIAVECRARSRMETVEWIDSLIGKYSRINVNHVVAIAQTRFAPAAKEKARQHNIELITVNEALTADWQASIERWRGMTHSFTLMRITALDASGTVLAHSEITPDGRTATHRDELSEHLYPVAKQFFMERFSAQIAAALEAKIAQRWQHFIDDPTPRWAEVQVRKPGITRHGQDMGVELLVFGVGTFFHVGSPGAHFALSEYAISDIRIQTMTHETGFHIITERDGKFVMVGAGLKDEGR